MRELRKTSGRIEEVKKGKLVKPNPVDKELKRLAKVEERTDFLIKKSESRKNKKEDNGSLTTNEHVINNKLTTNEHFQLMVSRKKEASHIEYLCLKGLPKQIMAEIRNNLRYDETIKAYVAFLETEKIKQITGKSANHIAVQIMRMVEQGFFEILHSTKNGTRLISVNAKILGITQ